MKTPSEKMAELYDWFVPFYEKALPKDNPKIPGRVARRHAAEMAYDKSPEGVPEHFNGEFLPRGFPPRERKIVMVNTIARWAELHKSRIKRYMKKMYNVNVVHHDGHPSRGERIVVNRSTDANIEALEAQGRWNNALDIAVHEVMDFEAQEISRIQPNAHLERHKVVTIASVTKPKDKK